MVETQSVQKVNLANFKTITAPRRKAGLRDDQVSTNKHSINLPASVAAKLGDKVALLFSDTDKAIAIQKAADGEFELGQVGKNKNTRSICAKTIIEVKK